MQIEIRQYEQRDAVQAAEIWNEVVEDGKAFPQMEKLDEVTGHAFFTEQTYTGVAYDAATGELVGLYILHPNNVGRCGHICNASYAVKKSVRGQHIGEKLVKHCIAQGKTCGFRVLQFNAVVKSNTGAAGAVQKAGIHTAWRDSGRIFEQGRRIRGYYPALPCSITRKGEHHAFLQH